MSRLVMTHTAIPVGDHHIVHSFDLGITKPDDDVVIALLHADGDPECVSYLATQSNQLADAIASGIAIAQRHDYLIDEVLIVGWPT